MNELKFEDIVKEEMEGQRGVNFPVKASFAERVMIKNISPFRLHPNPDDEFCDEKIGPSFRIISEYVEKIKIALRKDEPVLDEPVIIQKLYPRDYIIINGHHRWAAAIRLGVKKIPVRIVNFASEKQVKKLLSDSANDKRVVFDLDEVIFRPADDPYLEKPLHFPFNIRINNRIRLGVPALFHYFEKEGYDIWLYSAGYYSYDDIEIFFRHYKAHIEGAITGTAKKNNMRKRMEKLLSDKYVSTLHIDNETVLLAKNDPQEFAIKGNSGEWSREIMDIMKGLK